MSNTIVLGDTHGQNKWKKIIEANKDADEVIFIGDYFDSFTIPFSEQLSNFVDILNYKTDNKDKVVLLLGNHDYQYLSYGNEYLIINDNGILEVGIIKEDDKSNCCDFPIINGRCNNPKCLEMCN